MKLLYLVFVMGLAALAFAEDNSPSPMQQLEDTIMMENEERSSLQDLIKSWGKRAWGEVQTAWDKRLPDANKRAWNNLHSSGWGKRAWTDLQSSGWGKRGWSDLQSSGWGKRTEQEEAEYNQMEKKSWDSLHGGWGKRAADWGSFRGSWGKRDPAWQNLKGLWGKRSYPYSESFKPGLNNLEEEIRRIL